VLAQLLADVSLPGDVLCLHGGVGTGKSYFWCATLYDSQRIALRGRVHWFWAPAALPLYPHC
jgi:hypothetical protein